MIHIELKNLITHEVFEKTFYDAEAARKFRIKCRYSKKVRIINAWGFENEEEMNWVMGY